MSAAPSDYQRSNVRLLPTLTVDDFLGCEACFEGRHGTREKGRCVCCGWAA